MQLDCPCQRAPRIKEFSFLTILFYPGDVLWKRLLTELFYHGTEVMLTETCGH